MAQTMKGCTPAVQRARFERLERLFFEDGRDKREHPFAFTYTGLWEQYGDGPLTDEP